MGRETWRPDIDAEGDRFFDDSSCRRRTAGRGHHFGGWLGSQDHRPQAEALDRNCNRGLGLWCLRLVIGASVGSGREEGRMALGAGHHCWPVMVAVRLGAHRYLGGHMVVATFGPSTGWAGKSIDYSGEKFFLEEIGAISRQDVVEYDQQGHLVWESPETRAWVIGVMGSSYLPAQATVAAEPAKMIVVATFNPETGWAGKTITHCDGVFTLEDVGRISARDVLEYDRNGFITWAYDGLRQWVRQVVAAQGEHPTPKKASEGLLVAGFIFCGLGTLIGLMIILEILLMKAKMPDGHEIHKYDDSSRRLGKVMIAVFVVGSIVTAPVYIALLTS